MIFELNPFRLITELLNEIKSITVTSNLDWLDVPSGPITGENAFLPISARTDVTALRVFATGVSPGTPAMIPLLASHIPSLPISQVTGLQSAINSLVKTFASANTSAIGISANGSGDYTLTPHFGTTANTIAQGNDGRFPSNVNGIRRGTGVGSGDIAATPKVDYWNTDVFVGSGASHARGLVPDPGASPGTGKFLREDGNWVIPAGSGTVTSVGLALPGIFSVSGTPVTGSGTLTGALVNQSANLIFAGPTSGGAAAPTFRAHVFADFSALIGTGASNIAVGNDTRFPASVTGIRKGAGAGSTDTAAVKWTDYWDNTVFGGKGPAHSIGLVPDPGAGAAPYVRYLRDDGTWQPFTPDTGTLINSQLSLMGSKTLKANATAGIASPTDVSAKTARSSALLNLESISLMIDANYSALSTDRYISTSANLTAIRTVTLPLANAFNPSQQLVISDDFGAINGANTISIARQGSDTIQGSSSPLSLDVKWGSYHLTSDGVSKWFVTRKSPGISIRFFTSNTTYNTPTGVKSLFVQVIAGGGGGGGALGAGSQCGLGGGGGAGGSSSALISAPASSYVITIGAGGAGGVGAAGGSNGGDTSFGVVAISQGGTGGGNLATGTSIAFAVQGSGGTSTNGDILSQASSGTQGIRLSGTAGISGNGGAQGMYGGAPSGLSVEANGNSIGAGYGAGGAGALSYSVTSKTGGAGRQGIVIVTEYY